MIMLMTYNAKEREKEEWNNLFQEADPRFKLLGASQPPGYDLWNIELCWEG